MVCRENKGRSSTMGIVKFYQRHDGGEAMHDALAQSTQHEFKHQLEAMNELAVNDPKAWQKAQVEIWRNQRQMIIDDPTISDAAKYRVSEGRGGQPGLVTRIDQELERLRTGKDEKGRQLRPEQLNTPADLASVMRMGAILERIKPAQDNFLEMNARHRGVPMADVRREWNQLMNRKGDFSNISLTDTYRDDMAIAGLSARDQSDLGQSGRARDAMRIMEDRRKEHLATLPSRQTIRKEHTLRTFIDPKSEAATMRCDQCGQFGHLQPACPNTAAVQGLAAVDKVRADLQPFVQANAVRSMLGAPDHVIAAQMEQSFPGVYDDVDEFRAAHKEHIDTLLGGRDPMSPDEIRNASRIADKRERIFRNDIKEQGGTPSWIKTVEYNPETGLLVLTPHPRTLRDGSTKQDNALYRRVSPENINAVLDHSTSPGKAINEMGMIRGAQHEVYGFENPADFEAALQQNKCPTCGRWASLNSQHRCPVQGSPSEDYRVREIAASTALRDQQRRVEGTYDGIESEPMLRKTVFTAERKTIRIRTETGTVEGEVRTANPVEMLKTCNAGNIATPAVRATYSGASVSGSVSAWVDPDGQLVLSHLPTAGGKGLACSCDGYRDNGRCAHVHGTAVTLAKRLGAHNAGSSAPGGLTAAANTAVDTPIGDQNRLSYSAIQRARLTDNAEYSDMYRERASSRSGMSSPSAMSPKLMDGTAISEPALWERTDGASPRPGAPVDLEDTKQVTARLRRLLSGRALPNTAEYERVSFSVTKDDAGGIRVDIPPKHRKTADAPRYREALSMMMGATTGTTDRGGFYIQPTGSARSSALDRAAGDEQRIQPSRWFVSPEHARRAADTEHRAAHQGMVNQPGSPSLTAERTDK